MTRFSELAFARIQIVSALQDLRHASRDSAIDYKLADNEIQRRQQQLRALRDFKTDISSGDIQSVIKNVNKKYG